MPKCEIYNINNLDFKSDVQPELIYGDMIYENENMEWIAFYWNILKENGIFQVQTDYHTSAKVKLFLDSMPNSYFVNEIIYKQEWGGTPKKGFPMKHDNIYIYAKGKDWYWDSSNIQIKKKTAGTAFDKKGTGLKTPCSVFDDIGNFSTMSNERLKGKDGKNIRWQKPLALMRRLITPFVQPGYTILDPFLGSGTTGIIAKELDCNFIGIESEYEIYKMALERLS